MPRKLFLITAAIVSLAAQWVLFVSGKIAFIPEGERTPLISILFAVVLVLYSIVLWRYPSGSRTDWLFPSLQLITVLGLLFLLDSSGSRVQESGFLLTGIVTLLSTYALFISSAPILVSPTEPVENNIVELSYEMTGNVESFKEEISSLDQQLTSEKYRNTQLTLLNELSQQLEAELDLPVSAQLAVNTLERAMECSLVALFVQDTEHREFEVLASAGSRTSMIPPGYRQGVNIGLLGRAAKVKKTLIVGDTRLEQDFVRLENENTLSVIYIPILEHGHVKGVLEICSEKTDAFGSLDAAIAEGVASEMLRAWERSSYQQHISELIQAGISPDTLMMDPQASVQEVAIIARKTLEAQFAFVTLLDQQGNFSRTASAGDAPKLLESLNANPLDEPLLQAALNATKPFRVRDIRKYSSPQKLAIDHSGLRSALAIPIRLHRFRIGAIIAFGKKETIFFSDKDESLADLLSWQAAAAIESSWLYQDLRSKGSIYKLLVDIMETEELGDAAEKIAQSIHKMTNATESGIILTNRDGQVEAEVGIDENGYHTRREHPMDIIDQAIKSGQPIIVSLENGSLGCIPLLTSHRSYGAFWYKLPQSVQYFGNFDLLASQAAMAWARSLLLSETRQQAKQLEEAYDHTLKALMSALDARDSETEGHSTRVSQLSYLLGEKIGLNSAELKDLARGALLHDLGKIGIRDSILLKAGGLDDDEWRIMRMHPEIGARIVEKIPFLQHTLPVITSHHERWDGSGYPARLKENEIPIQARIFAVADVFDALTSSRAYRRKSSPEEAMAYLKEQSGILFDPVIVEALSNLPYANFIQR